MPPRKIILETSYATEITSIKCGFKARKYYQVARYRTFQNSKFEQSLKVSSEFY